MSLVYTPIHADDRVPLGHRRSRSLPSMTSPDHLLPCINTKCLSYYSKLPEEPLRLSVLKLDGSSFEIEVMRSATVAELKEAVQAVFSYVPRNGLGQISWTHVWGHFCLCYDGRMLLEDKDCIRSYGIRDGDQLEFIQHVSPRSSSKGRSIKWISSPRKQRRSPSKSSRHGEKQRDESDDSYDDTENGGHNPLDEMDYSIVEDDDTRTGHLSKRQFLYSRLPTIQRARSLTNSPPPRSTNGFFVHIRRMMLLCGVNQCSQRNVIRDA